MDTEDPLEPPLCIMFAGVAVKPKVKRVRPPSVPSIRNLPPRCGMSLSPVPSPPWYDVPSVTDEAGGGGRSTEEGSSTLTPVLRISQLDAFELDGALEQLPELKALLQLLVWRFTIYSRSATVGQSLLNIRYKNDLSRAQRYRPMSRWQKLWFALCTVGERWLTERSHGLFLNRPAESGVHQARRALAFLTGIAKVAGLLNFLVFLQRGRFPTLTERLLGVRAVFCRPQGVRDVGFQYVNRELLWHGFAEFLIFLFPLVNTRRLRASVRSLFSPAGGVGGDATEAAHCTECALCGEWPTMPHTVGCSHVFCYYCVKSHAIADAYLSCPKCGSEARSVEPVKMQNHVFEATSIQISRWPADPFPLRRNPPTYSFTGTPFLLPSSEPALAKPSTITPGGPSLAELFHQGLPECASASGLLIAPPSISPGCERESARCVKKPLPARVIYRPPPGRARRSTPSFCSRPICEFQLRELGTSSKWRLYARRLLHIWLLGPRALDHMM
ncbi:hypothetical protein AAFF_G00094660 [Aldrovandia affinis]|uniref:Peroxisome biogenesis factor 2 n=1 Tax=Aldrovandia affinis TaxID=143900 RepID=A0AAD7T3D8_9TELE|nr:hypothetical protein AAFF_G00094660 [Aldrovandia affinis]